MDISFRKAAMEDVEDAIPLIYSSGPDAFDYIFKDAHKGSAQDFLEYAFCSRGGEMGYTNHTIIEFNGAIAGIGAGWTGKKAIRFAIRIGWKIFRFYGLIRGLNVVVRGLRFEKMVRPPGSNEYVIAHLGVKPPFRGKGIGSRLIEELMNDAEHESFEKFVLDVSYINPRAQALYQRLGFTVAKQIDSNLQRKKEGILVPGHTRMELKRSKISVVGQR